MAGTPETYQDAHEWADVDATTMSAHHTLGPGAVQAAPGNHNHDGRYAIPDHEHEAADPAPHEHPLYLPIINEVEPTINPDGMPLKVGQLWVDTDTPYLKEHFWTWGESGAVVTATGMSSWLDAVNWDKILFTAPSAGIIKVDVQYRVTHQVTTGTSSAEMRIIATGTGVTSYCDGAPVPALITRDVGAMTTALIKVTQATDVTIKWQYYVSGSAPATYPQFKWGRLVGLWVPLAEMTAI